MTKRSLTFSIFAATIIVIAGIGCTVEVTDNHSFRHNIPEGPKPWLGEIIENGNPNFTFAIISDLNGGERSGVFSTAVNQLNRLNPIFVLSIGDLIDGGTEDSTQLAKEWDSFDQRASKLEMPFFHLGGNHDLTNPRMREFWKNRYGPRYYHFVYNDVLFLMVDSEDFEEERMLEVYHARAHALKIISGEIEGIYEESEYYNMLERRVGAISKEQTSYFKNVLENYPDVRWTFILMHKPVWMREDEKNLEELESALSNRHYSVINGHFHSFSHRIRNGQSYTILGTTGGGQNPTDSMAFDHVTLVRMDEKPVVTHLKMDGILDEEGRIPTN